MVDPPEPITAPILSLGTVTFIILGANSLISSLDDEIVASMLSKIANLAILACSRALFIISNVIPFTFISICNAVTPSRVPATLKSISPEWSSAPCISVNMAWFPDSSVINPIAIPATGAFIGTPPSIIAKDPAQTLAIEVDPLDSRASDTSLIVYGKSSWDGTTGLSAFSARAPWPTSLLPVNPNLPASPTE